MSLTKAHDVSGVGGQRVASHSGQGLSTMEDWLRRAMAELAAHGPNEVAPVDLTESLSALAALLRDAVQSKPARNGAFIDPPVTAKAEDERPL